MQDNIKDYKENYETAIIIEPIFDNDNIEEKIAEIEALVDAAGAKLFKTVCQKIRVISPSTIVGHGKLLEIKEMITDSEVNLVVFDGELSPSQLNNVSDILEIKVINRTTLILDIFAIRARSLEGKILVELAQLKYIYPRLSGKGTALSRLGGGIGTRGPGETKLETDRRHIKTRIKYLERSLNEIEKRRNMQSYHRKRNDVKTIAIVGYTNTGKSTLLNLLTKSDILAKNQLFATLDPTARKAKIDGLEVVFIDTVGFIKELPPDLMEAFKSTLDCARDADLILNVFDISDNWQMQIESTERTLDELKAQAPILRVANKCDKISDFENLPRDFICISAKENKGIDELFKCIKNELFSDLIEKTFEISYDKEISRAILNKLCKNFDIKYNEENILLKAQLKKENLIKLINYLYN